MKYDKEIQTQYGFIHGSKTLVFIKTGRGGSIYGYQDKYVRISHAINDRFGYSVCVSANPPQRESNLSEEIAFVNQEQQINDIYFIGVSNGALVGAQQGYRESRIKGMLLINGPLMINWYKTRKGIEAFCGKSVRMLYGERDPSVRYIELLDLIRSDVLHYAICEGADHHFAGKENYFNREIMDFLRKLQE